MKNEKLWYRLPLAEKAKIEEVINLIASKNLTKLSIKQLIEKLERNQAEDWIEVLSKYNSIPAINNINTSEMLARAKGVSNKFGQRGYPQLKDQEFEPRELLGLIILCYSNPNLIGPKLCKALNDNNVADIKKEILENSARVGNRVAPWASNLRLANYALYANDTTVLLPVNVTNRIQSETLANDNYNVTMIDEQFGLTAVVNCIDRGTCSRSKRDTSEIDAHEIFQSLHSDEHVAYENGRSELPLAFSVAAPEVSHFDNTSQLTTEGLPLYAMNNAASMSFLNGGVLVGSLALYAARNTIGPVVRNVATDLATAGKYVGSFFSSKNNSEHTEQIDQKTSLLSPVVRP